MDREEEPPGPRAVPLQPCAACGEIRPRKPRRTCNQCEAPYHITCVKLTRVTSDAIPIWHCHTCRGIPRPGAEQPQEPIPRTDIAKYLAQCKTRIKVLARIPKGAVHQVAEAYNTLLLQVLENQSTQAWERLLSFCYWGLQCPNGENEDGNMTHQPLATRVRRQVADFLGLRGVPEIPPLQAQGIMRSTRANQSVDVDKEKLRKRVGAKFSDGDIRGAIRVLTSKDGLAPVSEETMEALRVKHPPAPEDLNLPLPPDDDLAGPVIVTESEVAKAVRSFRPGSSAGPDGLRPVHLSTLIGRASADGGVRLLNTLTAFINMVLRGEVPETIRPIFFGASLCALSKEGGGIRPIAVGNTLRRLATKVGALPISPRLGAELRPVQLGFSTRGGCEAAVHAARTYIAGSPENRVLLKIDMRNAFNTLRRDKFLNVARERVPSLYRLLWQAYSRPSTLFFGEEQIESSTGIQQGDPFGPALFSMGIDTVARSAASELNIWYLDDATIADEPGKVFADLQHMIEQLALLGLDINGEKCELFLLRHQSPVEEQRTTSLFQTLLPNIKILSPDQGTLLGAPISQTAIPEALRDKHNKLQCMTSRLNVIDPHQAFSLLKSCFAIPKLQYTLRASPAYTEGEELRAFDDTIRKAVESITNISFSDESWNQATLPVSKGGLGIRKAQDIALPSYLSSLHSVRPLVDAILPRACGQDQQDELTVAIEAWRLTEENIDLPEEEFRSKQKAWDQISSGKKLTGLLQSADQVSRSRLLAATQSESGLWLHAIPLSSLGTHLEPETLRIAISLRVGANVCQPHACKCGKQMDEKGLHSLSCLLSAGRFPRHSSLNDIIKRALQKAGIPSLIEPAGIFIDDARRPDGVTVFPYKNGRSLVWDCTCTDTYAECNLNNSATTAGSAASAAEDRKRNRYSDIAARYLFEPIAVETTGVFGKSTKNIVEDIGRRLIEATGEPRESFWLKQRLGLAVQRGNAFSILASCRSLPTTNDDM